jgi:hypothetical protein
MRLGRMSRRLRARTTRCLLANAAKVHPWLRRRKKHQNLGLNEWKANAMRALIVGAGAVGGYFGGMLLNAGGTSLFWFELNATLDSLAMAVGSSIPVGQ